MSWARGQVLGETCSCRCSSFSNFAKFSFGSTLTTFPAPGIPVAVLFPPGAFARFRCQGSGFYVG